SPYLYILTILQKILRTRTFCPDIYNVQNGFDSFFHILTAYPFHFTVKSMTSRKDIGARQSHERQSRAVCPTTNASTNRCSAGAAYGLQSNFHDLRILIQYLFPIAVLLLHLDGIGTAWLITEHIFH